MTRPVRSATTREPSGRIAGAVQTGAVVSKSSTFRPVRPSMAKTWPTVLAVYTVPLASTATADAIGAGRRRMLDDLRSVAGKLGETKRPQDPALGLAAIRRSDRVELAIHARDVHGAVKGKRRRSLEGGAGVGRPDDLSVWG